MRGSACFYCRNSINDRYDPPGWAYDCKLGIDNAGMEGEVEQVVSCPHGDPRVGFQIGGVYTHMYFEPDSDCLTWVVEESSPHEVHICDFVQLEQFVEFWGKELRRRGWIHE